MMRTPNRVVTFAASLSLCAFLAGCDGGTEPPVDEPRCGNGVVEGDEVCDGDESVQTTCKEQGQTAGTVGCSSSCKLDLTGCTYDACLEFYPCDRPGTRVGDVIDDLSFEAGNLVASDMSGGDGLLDLHDLYQANVDHGGELTGALIFVGAGWCKFCKAESAKLEALYQEVKDSGVIIIGAMLQDNRGRPATKEYADQYGAGYGWTFPSVAAPEFPDIYWPSNDSRGSVPFHVFVDLRNMRIFGTAVGGLDPKLLRYPLEELATGPQWTPDGDRVLGGNCSAEPTTESEPNSLNGTPEDASTLPFELTGAVCAPTIVNDTELDEDTIDLGVLPVGTVIDISMESEGQSALAPMLIAMRLDSTGRSVEWYQFGPTAYDGGPSSRQWFIDTEGHYFVSATDARMISHLYYATVPEEQACCEGGPDYAYALHASAGQLAPTESPLSLGASVSATLTPGSLQVYPMDVTTGTAYTISMKANVARALDPYLVLYDPATSTVLALNDDAAEGSNDARIQWTADADKTVWVVATYAVAFTVDGIPPYQLSVE